jgi:hypothetical protein
MRVLEELALAKSAILLIAWVVTGVGGGEPYDGELVAIQPEEIRVSQKMQEQFFAVNTQTKITLDGHTVKLAELPLGSRVLVLADASDATPLAKRIAATSVLIDGNGPLQQRKLVRR